MASEFTMPKLGLTMTEGTVSKWFKAVGDKVAMGEILVEVETDKITNQIESTAEGVVLELLVPEGSSAPCQAPIAIIGEPGEKVETTAAAAPAPAAAEEAPAAAAPTPSKAVANEGGFIKASPIAKRLAKEQGIDLALVTATGPEGRIVERDIVAYAEQAKVKSTPLAAKMAADAGIDLGAIAKDGRITKADVAAAMPKPAAAPAGAGKPISGMRKVISERMGQSWRTAPHVTFTYEVDMTAARDMKTKLAEVTGKKFSYTEMIVKCCATALTEFKLVNSSLIDGQIYQHEDVNVGVAVALDDGLIVPVVRNADKKSISAIKEDVATVATKARAGQLGPDEVTGGTFTVSNLGMYGVDEFTPIINQPETAILGVCRIVERPVVVKGEIVIRPMMNLCLSADHRLVDGSVAAQFMSRVRALLEQPLLLV